jgi:WhiB family redox-sensing transcriptional regulator
VAPTVYPPIAQLPPPITDHWNWQTAAACRGMDTNAFFHPTGERTEARQARIDAAKKICRGCPVTQDCLTHALKAREPYGIWGGQSENERAALLGLRSLRYPPSTRHRTPARTYAPTT